LSDLAISGTPRPFLDVFGAECGNQVQFRLENKLGIVFLLTLGENREVDLLNLSEISTLPKDKLSEVYTIGVSVLTWSLIVYILGTLNFQGSV